MHAQRGTGYTPCQVPSPLVVYGGSYDYAFEVTLWLPAHAALIAAILPFMLKGARPVMPMILPLSASRTYQRLRT